MTTNSTSNSGFRLRTATRLLLAAMLLAGCGREASESQAPTADREKDQESALTAVTRAGLEGLRYTIEFAGEGAIQLENGVFREAKDPDQATRTVVMLTRYVAFGDLDGDGVGDAVAVLETDPGGSGIFFELVAVVASESGPHQVASASLGDRTDVEDLKLADGVIRLDLITHGPEDPLCCPTAREARRYRLIGDTLAAQADDGNPPLVQGHG
jgi:hypothetical protein